MDPNQLAQALMQRDPSMSLDLAQRIAANLSGPGGAQSEYAAMYPGLMNQPQQPLAPNRGIDPTAVLRNQQMAAVSGALGFDGSNAYTEGVDRGMAHGKGRRLIDRYTVPEPPPLSADVFQSAKRVLDEPTLGSFSKGLSEGQHKAQLDMMRAGQPGPNAALIKQVRQRRVARYHELMAAAASGKTITDEERAYLDKVSAAMKGTK